MKKYYDATSDTSNAVAPVLTSDKLTALKQQFAEAWGNLLKFTDPFAKETKDANMAVWKIQGEIKAEEAAILKLQNDAKIAQARNERLALNQSQLDAFAAFVAIKADKKASPESIDAAQMIFMAAKEKVDNELLAKFAGSSPAKKSVTTTGTDTTAEPKSNPNKSAILEMYLAGKTHAEIEDAGFKRSTVWHTINNYKKANGIS